MDDDALWWQKAVFYQIYPRSFADGNGDGIGDFTGMIDRLDYLHDLGVDAIWLSPHYPSPMCDCGYDVSDYTAVAPEYGTLEQFGTFLTMAHERNMRVILDLVLNHTSDQHPWFIESRSSRTNPKRDWYIWRDGRDGAPPNNWYSAFGGPAWEWDETTSAYYYHYFFKGQPDLNWSNPQVKAAMFACVRFWLDMGVDGFRLDAVGTLFEHPDWRDHQVAYTLDELYRLSRLAKEDMEKRRVEHLWRQMFHNQWDQPGVHEVMRELRTLVDETPGRVLVGETDSIDFYGNGCDELHLVFNFPLMGNPRLTPAFVRSNQRTRLAALPKIAWPCNTLGNHDSPRVFSNYGDGENDDALARLHLVLLLTLRGTPFLYNGEEIGMRDYYINDPAQFRDPLCLRIFQLEREVMGSSVEEATYYAARKERDKGRTPMQWADAVNGGFCPAGVTPWLPVNPDYARGVNVESQLADPSSLLNFYRRALHMRRENPALLTGEYHPLHVYSRAYLAFLRNTQSQHLLVVLNMSRKPRRVGFDFPQKRLRLVFSTHERDVYESPGRFALAPFEAFIGELV